MSLTSYRAAPPRVTNKGARYTLLPPDLSTPIRKGYCPCEIRDLAYFGRSRANPKAWKASSKDRRARLAEGLTVLTGSDDAQNSWAGAGIGHGRNGSLGRRFRPYRCPKRADLPPWG